MIGVIFSTPVAASATIAAVASVPIVIHLLNRRRFRIVDWAAMRFLLAAQKQNVRRLRVEQWLLLATRCGILALLALALAAVTPWAESWWQQLFPGGAFAAPAVTGRTHKVIILDGSLSMTYLGEQGVAFDRARSMAAELVRSSAGGDGFSVIFMGTPLRAIVPGPGDDAEKVASEIEMLRCSHGSADLGAALSLAEELIRRAPGKYAQREIYIFSDLQKGTWPQPTSPSGSWAEPWSRLQAQAQLIVLDVGTDGAPNLAVADLTISDPQVVVGVRTTVTTSIHNWSPRARTGVRAELLIGRDSAAPAALHRESLSIPAGGVATVTFPIQFPTVGDYVVQVRLPFDGLAADDVRSMIVSVRPSLPVLLVEGKPGVDRREQAASWLSDALNPFADDMRRPQFPAQPSTINLAQFADPVSGDLSNFDAVFLCDVPRLTEREVGRLEAHLQRGGGLVIGLGPNVDLENYNRLLGRILPGRLVSTERSLAESSLTLQATDEAFQRSPLAAFAADHDRAALLAARFRQYVRLEPAPGGASRKLLTFVPPAEWPNESKRLALSDPLVIERSHHRGRVVVVTSTFNTEWTSWPIAPSFAPFVQELLRFVVRSGPRRTSQVGEALDEWLSVGGAGLNAIVTTPDDDRISVALQPLAHATHFQLSGVDRSGVYRLSLDEGQSSMAFAVNVLPRIESDLARISAAELRSFTPDEDVQIVHRLANVSRQPKRAADVKLPEGSIAPAAARGPSLARGLLGALVAFLVLESLLAWRFGSARSGSVVSSKARTTSLGKMLDLAASVVVCIVSAAAVMIGVVLVHAAWTGDFLGFLSENRRNVIESALGVPAAATGEGTKWRLDFLPYLSGNTATDRWLVGAIGTLTVALAIGLYRRELPRSRRSFGSLFLLIALRIAMFGLAVTVLLPQVQLLFEREGWPDFVVLIDDSQSMSHSDDQKSHQQRLQAIQALLTKDDAAWLQSLVGGRQTKLRIYRCSDRAERIVEIEGRDEWAAAVEAVRALKPQGATSRLGTAVQSVLQEFRGSTLAGIVVLTDGITTEGDDLVSAARAAARAGVPLYPVGVGDVKDSPDLWLHDLQVDDSVHVQDRLVFEARLTARGGLRTPSVPVTLLELDNDQWKPIKHETIQLDSTGKPVRVQFKHAPTQSGERRFALEVPLQSEESDSTNNRLERTVLVAEAHRTRVLYIEGYARYEYRFLKSMLERESQSIRGNKSIDLSVLLADADADHAKQDRSAVDALPATREELFRQFDLIILGDVDPRHAKLGEKHLQWIADFVREKGGGLLTIAGTQFMPSAYRDTPIADVLPIELSMLPSSDDAVQPGEFRLRLTPVGQMHPLFRLAPDEMENRAVWDRLRPIYWSAERWKLKPAAEVLAVRSIDAAREGEPMAVQQFVGAGRVLYFGFDESWRWRRLEDERLYNQFWIQAVRFLSRSRLGRCDLRLDRQTPYRQGEPIRVSARFPDDAPPPASDASVLVAVEFVGITGDRESQTLELSHIEGSRGTYEGIVVRTDAGSYRFRLSSPASEGPQPEAAARVLPPPGEMDQFRMNRSDLERAALVSRGRFYLLADAERLPGELPEFPRVALHQPRPPYPLWSHPAWLGVGLSLMGCEWLLRKRHHLL